MLPFSMLSADAEVLLSIIALLHLVSLLFN